MLLKSDKESRYGLVFNAIELVDQICITEQHPQTNNRRFQNYFQFKLEKKTQFYSNNENEFIYTKISLN
jgi:hypothetical protein